MRSSERKINSAGRNGPIGVAGSMKVVIMYSSMRPVVSIEEVIRDMF